MFKLIVQSGEEKGQIVYLSGQEITIGRDPGNGFVLSDKRVSRRHARLFKEGENYILEDLKSVNGTRVNQMSVARQILNPGDEIQLGEVVMVFLTKGQNDGPSSQPTDSKIEKSPFSKSAPILSRDGLTVEYKISAQSVSEMRARLVAQQANDALSQRLHLLYTVSDDLGSVRTLTDLLNRILVLVLDIMKADRSYILLEDDESGEMAVKFVHKRPGLHEQEGGTISKTIIAWVLKTGESILTSDAGTDARFQQAQSVIVHGIRSTMCVPLRIKGQILGILQVDTKDRVMGFGKDDLELLTVICSQASVAIENAKLFDNLRKANTELFEQQKQLIEAVKLSALGLMAGGMVHEIRNPLHSMSMLTEAAGDLLAAGTLSPEQAAECHKYIKSIKDKIYYCENIVKSLLQFARRKEIQMIPTSMNNAIEAALIIAQFYMVKSRVEIKKEFDVHLPKVKADPNQLQQVFLNIIVNATDAMEGVRGTLTITSRVASNGQLEARFADTGHGIPADKLSEIFKPLYTTKGEGKGTGLGLSISKDIIENHKGTISVESKEGHGTTFIIRLPPLIEAAG